MIFKKKKKNKLVKIVKMNYNKRLLRSSPYCEGKSKMEQIFPRNLESIIKFYWIMIRQQSSSLEHLNTDISLTLDIKFSQKMKKTFHIQIPYSFNKTELIWSLHDTSKTQINVIKFKLTSIQLFLVKKLQISTKINKNKERITQISHITRK